jgi:hypothetical protein
MSISIEMYDIFERHSSGSLSLKSKDNVETGEVKQGPSGKSYKKQADGTWKQIKIPSKIPESSEKRKKACCSACAKRDQELEEREQTPAQVKHCVAKVADQYGGDTSKAFAICVAAGQKHGTLKKGSISSTKKGKKADRHKSRQDGHSDVVAGYEELLAKSRKQESETLISELERLLV